MNFLKRHAPIGLLVVSVVLSAGWIVLARNSANSSDPGRGGAIAVALSFAYLFLTPSKGRETFAFLAQKVLIVREEMMAPTDDVAEQIGRLRDRMNRIADAIVGCQRLDDKAIARQNALLAASSVVGTLAWGFGDLIAKILQ